MCRAETGSLPCPAYATSRMHRLTCRPAGRFIPCWLIRMGRRTAAHAEVWRAEPTACRNWLAHYRQYVLTPSTRVPVATGSGSSMARTIAARSMASVALLKTSRDVQDILDGLGKNPATTLRRSCSSYPGDVPHAVGYCQRDQGQCKARWMRELEVNDLLNHYSGATVTATSMSR